MYQVVGISNVMKKKADGKLFKFAHALKPMGENRGNGFESMKFYLSADDKVFSQIESLGEYEIMFDERGIPVQALPVPTL